MPTITVIRAAIGVALERIPGLVVEANLADSMTIGEGGAAVVGGPTANLVNTMGRGNVTWNFPIYVLAGTAVYENATETLDELVGPYGDRAIPQLFWDYGRANGELGQGFGVLDSNGECDLDAHISELTAYGVEFPIDGVPHIGAVLNAVVHAPGRQT